MSGLSSRVISRQTALNYALDMLDDTQREVISEKLVTMAAHLQNLWGSRELSEYQTGMIVDLEVTAFGVRNHGQRAIHPSISQTHEWALFCIKCESVKRFSGIDDMLDESFCPCPRDYITLMPVESRLYPPPSATPS